MLLLLHSLTRKRCKMPRQARKVSGMVIRQRLPRWYSPACKADGKMVSSVVADSSELRINVKSGTVYIVKVGGKTLKIAM